MAVTITPMPRSYLKIPKRLRPSRPPLYDSPPTEEDRALAKALLAELDPESREWYGQLRSDCE